ncbi:MAG: tetratricopeptide repeat protein [Bdellovibrionaceae bacterium]|nr:tetratricopeptide repeat protein [Pseudobdellovibrionaceae bacterium]
MKVLLFFNLITMFFLSGCLTTRSQMKEQSQLQSQVANIQESKADLDVRLQDFENQMREFNGRIEVLENDSRQFRDYNGKTTERKKIDDGLLENKFKVIQEALLKIETELQRLSVELDSLRTKNTKKETSSSSNKGNYQQAESDFSKKKWKEAAVGYQKYRDLNSKGKYYADATYKIGVCFQEMGMKKEAKAFYEEIIEKYPKSHITSKAQYRLKNLK